jgi:hypothetical protein
MSANNKIRNIINYLLDDVAEVFPILLLLYLGALLSERLFFHGKDVLNWSMLHINILALGLLSFLSHSGRANFFSFLRDTKIEFENIITFGKAKNIGGSGGLFTLICRLFYIIATAIKRGLIWFIKTIVSFGALALDIKQRGMVEYLKFILLAVILTIAILLSANVFAILMWIYAFRAIFIGINSRISGGAATILLIACAIVYTCNQPEIAERLATFAYYFLMVAAVSMFVESRTVIHS